MAVYYKSASQKGEHMQTPGQQGETIPIFLSGEGLGEANSHLSCLHANVSIAEQVA